MTTVSLKGEGGVVWEFDLPLSEVFADQVKNRQLQPADEDSAAALAHLLADPEQPSDPAVAEPEPELTVVDRINAVTSHDDANKLAAELGVDGFQAKKPGIPAKKQALLDAAAAPADPEPADLAELTDDELMAKAAELGVDLDAGTDRDAVLAALRAKLAE